MLPHKWGPLRKYVRTLPDILAPISGNFFAKGLALYFGTHDVAFMRA